MTDSNSNNANRDGWNNEDVRPDAARPAESNQPNAPAAVAKLSDTISSVAMAPSGAQRDAIVERLSLAFADDAISMEEFDKRATLVYSALTVVDLQKLVVDLPGAGEHTDIKRSISAGEMATFPQEEAIRTVFANTERGGAIKVPLRLKLRTLFGNTELNYSRATFAPGVTEIDVRCTFGNIEITVPRGVRVELACSAILASVGSDSHSRDHNDEEIAAPGLPIVRLVGRALFANVEVHVAATDRGTGLTRE